MASAADHQAVVAVNNKAAVNKALAADRIAFHLEFVQQRQVGIDILCEKAPAIIPVFIELTVTTLTNLIPISI